MGCPFEIETRDWDAHFSSMHLKGNIKGIHLKADIKVLCGLFVAVYVF